MRNFLKSVAVIAAVAALAALPALATSQASSLFGVQVQPFEAVPVGGNMVAADTSPAIVIGYNGTTADPSVANTSTANITFLVGDAAYEGFECPVSGDLGGIIDVSDGACNTLGEVVDIINADQSDGDGFYAYIAAGLRADSSEGLLTDADDTDVSSPAGEVIYFDTSVADDNEVMLITQSFTQAQTLFDVLGGPNVLSAENRKLVRNPFNGYDTVLLSAQENLTNAGNITNFDALCVVENYAVGGGSEVATIMYRETGGATTVTGSIDEFLNSGGLRCRDGKVVVRIYADSADTSVHFVQAYGYRFKR